MKVTNQIELQLISPDHCDELFSLVDANREHLREWLPWVDANSSSADTSSFIQAAIQQLGEGKGPQYVIFFEHQMCGTCGFLPFDNINKVGEIGYWLSETYAGQGIMSKSVEALAEIGFSKYNLRQIEIACASKNFKSRAVPERLGFKFEGVIPEHKRLHGQPVEHAIYSIKKPNGEYSDYL